MACGINANAISQKTGISFFNAGSDMQSLVTSSILFDYVISNTKVDFVIVDAFAPIWVVDAYEITLIWLMYNHKPYSQYILKMVIANKNVDLFMKYIYFSIKEMLPFVAHANSLQTDTGNYKGNGFRALVGKRENNLVKFFDNDHFDSMSPSNKKAFDHIIQACKKNDIQLLFIVPKVLPTRITYNKEVYHNTKLKDASDIDISLNCFFDSLHLTECGTEVYTNWLSEQVLSY